MSALECIRKHSVLVADTANFELLQKFKPQDATTNPTLLLQAINMPQYAHVLEEAVKRARETCKTSDATDESKWTMLYMAGMFGQEILKIIPGRVSTETDARFSFDTQKLIQNAHDIIEVYKNLGISKDRILIKVASTWEGIRAAESLEKEGIHCNMTLLFSFAQAVACAEAGVTLVSPFVGRILDWYKKAEQKDFVGKDDPGVQSVQRIYNYYKKYGYKTIVMAASFRNTGEVKELCGCDYLTVSPSLMEELSKDQSTVERVLDPKKAAEQCKDPKFQMDELTFRWMMNEDAMATEKLAEGIRHFNKDGQKVEELVRQKLQ